jgi:hypothetical protein
VNLAAGFNTLVVTANDASSNQNARVRTLIINFDPSGSSGQPLPVELKLQVSAGPVIALGQTATLSAQASGGTAPYAFEWSPAAGLDNPNGTIVHVTPTATSTYVIKVTDAGGASRESSVLVKVLDPSEIVGGNGGDQGSGGDAVIPPACGLGTTQVVMAAACAFMLMSAHRRHA